MLARSTAAVLFTLLLSSVVPIAAADQFVGIGVQIKADDQGILVQKVIPGGPAEAAGVRDGDRIVEVDGKATAGITVPQFVEHARGLEGTKLNLLIERDGARQSLIVTRGIVKIVMVKRRMLDETVGLIELVGMEPNTDREFAEAIDELTGKGVKALVLDLRSNTNGSVDMVRTIVALFVPAGRPMWRVEIGGKVQDAQLTGAGVKWTGPIVAIISRDTGPVGELIATALQSNGPEATLPEGVEPLPVLLIGQRTKGIARLREMVSDGAGGQKVVDRGRVLAVDKAPITDRGIRPDQPVRGRNNPLDVALAEAQAMLK